MLVAVQYYVPLKGNRFFFAGFQANFFIAVVVVASIFLVLHAICAMKSILWMFSGNLSKLRSFMRIYADRFHHEEGLEDLNDIYYNNPDLSLLLNLLAESSGVSSSLKILALFDARFRENFQPKNIQIVTNRETLGEECYEVSVEFDEGELELLMCGIGCSDVTSSC